MAYAKVIGGFPNSDRFTIGDDVCTSEDKLVRFTGHGMSSWGPSRARLSNMYS